MKNLINILDSYRKYGCYSKLDKEGLLELINKEIDLNLSYLNQILKDFIGIKCNLNNYKFVKYERIPVEQREDFKRYRSSIRRLLLRKSQIEREGLYDLSLSGVSHEDIDVIYTDFLPSDYKSICLRNCVEDKPLVTLSFVHFEYNLFYKNTELFKRFGADSFNPILDYLKENNVDVPLVDLKRYLMVRSLTDEYKRNSFYSPEKLDDIDRVLNPLLENIIYYYEINPRNIMTKFLSDVFKSLDEKDVLYFFDYEYVTFKPSGDVDSFAEKLKSLVSASELNYVSYLIHVSNSLLDSFSDIDYKEKGV